VGAQLAEDEFLEMVRTFGSSAFRLETRDSYALGYERADFAQFLAGTPTPPPDLDWWRPWLDRVAQWAAEGKIVSRVRVLAEPPTDYQRWMLWADRWCAEVGEVIRYMPQSKAERIGLPLEHDWWLLDHERVVVMRFTDEGGVGSKELVTDPVAVAQYRHWRDVALWNASTAEHAAA
jgi:hypothetical protein